MFTGIVAGTGRIASISGDDVIRLVIDFSMVSTKGLETGASVSVDGVCLTVVEINSPKISFDVIPETLRLTTLGEKIEGHWVNLERALKMGDELGGHLLSGHIMGVGEIVGRTEGEDHLDLLIDCPSDMMKFVQEKGYLAIDGISLTVGKVDDGGFALHLIPETLALTTIGGKQLGEHVNIEVDSMTQTIVSTVERILEERL
ncbi:MAG: riboflavin synthase subunit alpha [Candidatus Poseidoniales archaeon]|nr:riboflavin synthase subunit alpha [Candidatus Poseidoniales archaeon]|tara:strand:- start:714 stop:1319 length:606 start_codon:yes stop_codon:yes gene_type:complete